MRHCVCHVLLQGSSHSEAVYVVKVVRGGASEGRLLTGDRVLSVNGKAAGNYQQTLAVLKSCGPQLTIEVQRKAAPTDNLPPGTCCSFCLVTLAAQS